MGSGRRCYPDTGGCYTDSEDSQDMDQEDMDMEDNYSGAMTRWRTFCAECKEEHDEFFDELVGKSPPTRLSKVQWKRL